MKTPAGEWRAAGPQHFAAPDRARTDRLLSELEPLAEHAHDLQTFRSIWKLVVVHGGGPWDPDEIAAMTGHDLDSVHRVLTDLLRAGLAPPAS